MRSATASPGAISELRGRGLEDVAALQHDYRWAERRRMDKANGLRIQRIATPIGVIGMIYESGRTSVRCVALCLKSGQCRDSCGAVPTVEFRTALSVPW